MKFSSCTIFSSTMFFEGIWMGIFFVFWWTGEYINFTCYNVVFTTIILILEKLKIWWLTQQRQKMFQNSCHGQQKISDFCGGNVGIFKWLFSRQKMSAKYFMMHKKVGDDNKNALNGILIFFCGNREINLLSEKDKKKNWWKPELLDVRNEELYLLNFCDVCEKLVERILQHTKIHKYESHSVYYLETNYFEKVNGQI